MIVLLQVLGAAKMIVMTMGEDQVLHLRRIEAQFLVASNDNPFRFLGIIQAVDLDNAFARDDGPGRNTVRSEIIELIKHLGRRRIHNFGYACRGIYRRQAAVHQARRQIIGSEKPCIRHVIEESHGIWPFGRRLLGIDVTNECYRC